MNTVNNPGFALKVGWEEKYRPNSLPGCILVETVKNRISGILGAATHPNLLLYGPPGSGKTTVAKLIGSRSTLPMWEFGVAALMCELKNDPRGLTINGCACSPHLNCIEEAGDLPSRIQETLPAMIDESINVGWIFVTTDPNRLSGAIRSRLLKVSFHLSIDEYRDLREQMKNRCRAIINENQCGLSDEEINKVLDSSFPDMRSTLRELQTRCRSFGKAH